MEGMELERPRRELSGPKLAQAFETLVSRADEHGGIERYSAALQLKSRAFRESLAEPDDIGSGDFEALCAHLATVRRRIGPWLGPSRFDGLRSAIGLLLRERGGTKTTDERGTGLCGFFSDGREPPWG